MLMHSKISIFEFNSKGAAHLQVRSKRYQRGMLGCR